MLLHSFGMGWGADEAAVTTGWSWAGKREDGEMACAGLKGLHQGKGSMCGDNQLANSPPGQTPPPLAPS